MNDRSEFYRRMTEYDEPTPADAATSKAWVDRFLNAIDALRGKPAPAPEPLLTADEVRRLDFLRHRLAAGEIAP